MSSSEELGSAHPVNRLIHELAESRRPVTDEEIQSIHEHVSGVGFNPVSTVRAGARIAGLAWDGRTVQRSDRLHDGPIHYLKHVVKEHEWPARTTYDGYVNSLRGVIGDPTGGIAIEIPFGEVRLSFVGRSSNDRGPRGSDWILVGYNVDYGWWATGFQPDRGVWLILCWMRARAYDGYKDQHPDKSRS